jgi:Arc/MetJ-type ribon-helix-helix transcriptional regulator
MMLEEMPKSKMKMISVYIPDKLKEDLEETHRYFLETNVRTTYGKIIAYALAEYLEKMTKEINAHKEQKKFLEWVKKNQDTIKDLFSYNKLG